MSKTNHLVQATPVFASLLLLSLNVSACRAGGESPVLTVAQVGQNHWQ